MISRVAAASLWAAAFPALSIEPETPKEIPEGKPPALDGKIETAEWKDALTLTREGLALYLKHDAHCLYLAVDCPLACSGAEECYLLLSTGAGGSAPAAGDLQLDFTPFGPSRLPWAESKGDGKSWVAAGQLFGWMARAWGGVPDRLQVEFAVSLSRLGPGERPEARLGLILTGSSDRVFPEGANLFTPSSWLPLRLAGAVADEPSKRGDRESEILLDLKERLAKAKEAREAFTASRARHEDLLKHKDPPKSQAEALALRQSFEAAVQGFNKAVSLEPDNPIFPFTRGEFYYSVGDAEMAYQDLALAHKVAPGISHLTMPLCNACMRSNRYAEALALAEEEVSRHGNRPGTFVLRGQLRLALQQLDGAVADFEKASSFPLDSQQGRYVDELLASAKALQAAWPVEAEARKRDEAKGDLPRAEILTERGRIVVELLEDDAPNTVANFVKLAESKFFDGLRFHRVIGDFMVQGGDPRSVDPNDPRIGAGGPGYRMKSQTGSRHHWRGTLSMANSGPDTDGSQFFITVKPCPHLDGKHSVFGRVLEGQEVADAVKPWDLIKSIRVLRKRSHPYVPETLPLVPPKPPER